MNTSKHFRVLPALVMPMLLAGGAALSAEIDTVYRMHESKGIGGQITSVSKTEVVVTQKIGNKEEHIPANEIARVEWHGEPPVLSLARGHENSGNLGEALAGYQEALKTVGETNPNLQGDIEFLIARASAKMAQADSQEAPAALQKLNSFVNDHREHYRFYHAQQLLGTTALVAGDYVAAESAFERLQQAPWPDFQLVGKIGAGRTLLGQNKVREAQAIFDQVASTSGTRPAEKSVKLEAMLCQAECWQRQNDSRQATQTLQQVIDQIDQSESRLLAEAYLQLGHAQAADGQHLKDAVLAYLHLDVIPALAAYSDLHAEALYHLARLWPAIGQPARGAEASARLEQQYPHSEWAKKLASGS